LPNVGQYICTTLAFLALLVAPYIYEISSLRVKGHFICCQRTKRRHWNSLK